MIEERVAPLAPGEIDDMQRAYLAPFTDAKGRYPNIFGVLCRNMPLMEAWRPFGLYTMRGSRVDPVSREVLILRTARNMRCEYEWHQHRRLSLHIGMTESLIEQVGAGDATGNEEYDLMVRCADELATDKRLSDALWSEMVERFGLEYVLDAVFTVGAYSALAMGLNSCGVQIEGRSAA